MNVMASFIYGGGSPIYNMAHLTSILLMLPGMMAFENNLYHFIFAQFFGTEPQKADNDCLVQNQSTRYKWCICTPLYNVK